MSSTMASTSWATIDEYTFNLTERLREAGRSSLAQFEASLGHDYDWLNDYLDNVEAQGARAPIAELMKTPSRTATAKKTRTATSANKARAEQVRQFNLALSPLAASPLQAQSLNALPPSPSRSPLKYKGAPLITKSALNTQETKPPKKKPGRPKKNATAAAIDKENVPTPVASPAPSKSIRSVLSPTSAPSKPSKSKSKKAKVSPKEMAKAAQEAPVEAPAQPEPEPVTVMAPESVVVPQEPVVEEQRPEAPVDVPEDVAMDEPEAHDDKDEPVEQPPAAEAASEKLRDSFETIPLETVLDVPTETKAAEEEPPVGDEKEKPVELQAATSPTKNVERAASPRSPHVEIPVVKAPSPAQASSPLVVKPSSPAKQSSPIKPSSPLKAASPAPALVRHRPVRSSWLSQALAGHNGPISHRTSTQYDSLRKSQMATSMAKRKSEEGADDDLDKENKRPDKVARFDPAATDAASGNPISPKKYFGQSRQPGSAASLPQPKVSTPASADLHTTATSVPQARWTKLQEMRERTAAAAAAKQQEKAAAAAAAAAAVTAAAQTAAASPSVTTNGAGFLRGLGNLGVGFLGLSASNPAPADDRRDKDREAQEMAEKELARVLKELEDEDRKKAEEAAAKAAAETMKAAESANKALLNVVDISDDDDEAGDRAILLSADEADEDEVNDSMGVPSLPAFDFDDESMEADAPGSALGAAGLFFKHSTTPSVSPPARSKTLPKQTKAQTKQPAKQSKQPQVTRSGTATPSKIPAPSIVVSPPSKKTGPVRTIGRPMTPAKTRAVTPSSMDEYEPDDEDSPPFKKAKANAALTSSQTSTLARADIIANKVLGVKATPGRVKSLQAAEGAAKREQELKERRAKQRAEIERKKEAERKQREEEERAKEEEERRKRREENEERRRRLAQNEKLRKEKLERIQKQRGEREASEAAEARAKQAEEEATRKRKLAPALTKSTSTTNLTKSTASSLNKSSASKAPAPATTAGQMKRVGPKLSTLNKGKEPAKASGKTGPNAFRTHEADAASSTSSTIKSVAAPARPTLGPPSRTSAVPGASAAAGPSHHAAHVQVQAQHTQVAATTLQSQRTTLQAQLDAKVALMESEAIVLPDIASEYSNSDDSDRETDFQRPAWAESPELKHALEAQANINPDELFGPIRPLHMEELFQGRGGKFRARTSSANWSGADRLTETEERDYARRMGFQPLKAPRDGGGAAGDR